MLLREYFKFFEFIQLSQNCRFLFIARINKWLKFDPILVKSMKRSIYLMITPWKERLSTEEILYTNNRKKYFVPSPELCVSI